MSYVDAFAVAVPDANRERFRTHSETMATVFKEHGALAVVQCWGRQVPDGEVTSFPMAVKCQPDETVTLGWITWPSREARDAGFEKAMSDPRMHPGEGGPPFDGKRLIYGGFEAIVEMQVRRPHAAGSAITRVRHAASATAPLRRFRRLRRSAETSGSSCRRGWA